MTVFRAHIYGDGVYFFDRCSLISLGKVTGYLQGSTTVAELPFEGENLNPSDYFALPADLADLLSLDSSAMPSDALNDEPS